MEKHSSPSPWSRSQEMITALVPVVPAVAHCVCKRPTGRVCVKCDARLSRYNRSDWCCSCQRVLSEPLTAAQMPECDGVLKHTCTI